MADGRTECGDYPHNHCHIPCESDADCWEAWGAPVVYCAVAITDRLTGETGAFAPCPEDGEPVPNEMGACVGLVGCCC
jgi:hypothetical protein